MVHKSEPKFKKWNLVLNPKCALFSKHTFQQSTAFIKPTNQKQKKPETEIMLAYKLYALNFKKQLG